MDKLSDFFKDLKERLSNPFISSFLISWLIINWKVFVGLFFYKPADLKVDGYLSTIDLITKSVTTNSGFTYPIFCSLAYTFVFPFFRNCIFAFDSWIKSWGRSWNMRITKESKIPMLKFIDLKENYQKQSQLLEETIEKEGQYYAENKSLHQTVSELTANKNYLFEELTLWKSANDVNALNGEWEFSLQQSLGNEKLISKVYISAGTIQQMSNNSQETGSKLTIKNYYKNPLSSQLFFMIEIYKQDSGGGNYPAYRYQRLDAFDNMKILRGMEDDIYIIEYRKLN